jgi:riboflavin kinase/FMN adenylyltransferase
MLTRRPGDKLPAGAAITIGTFDGLHRGHQYILAELTRSARERGCPAGTVTFDPSPQIVIHREFPYILTTLDEKLERLAEFGLGFVYLLRFDESLRATPAEVFLEQMILQPLHPSLLVEGYDHRFGSDRRGDAGLLDTLRAKYRFDVKVLPEFQYHGAAVNSTRIRERLVLGAVRQAGVLLGGPYRIQGRVVPGQGIGRGLGFPTVNLELRAEEKLIPAPGVYAVKVRMDERVLPGVMNIGFRPTVGSGVRGQGSGAGGQGSGTQSLEVHILDFNERVYDRLLAVEFIERLRPETKFASVEELKRQIRADIGLARLILADAEDGPDA